MLPVSYRLPSLEISRVMRSGKRLTSDLRNLSLIYKKRNADPSTNARDDSGRARDDKSRFAFIVSTKVDKRATIRNRIKRLMRESIHHVLGRITIGYDFVFIARSELKKYSQKEVEKEVIRLLERAGLIE